MTDKVQKIREKVERLMYGFNLEADIASCEDAETEKLANTKYQLCKKILGYIDEVQKEPVSEELEEAALMHLSKNYDTNVIWDEDEKCVVRDFKAGAKWQKQKDSIVSEELEEASKEWLRPQLDKSYANYGEAKMMELTHFDGYAMLDAIEFGAKWAERKNQKK